MSDIKESSIRKLMRSGTLCRVLAPIRGKWKPKNAQEKQRKATATELDKFASTRWDPKSSRGHSLSIDSTIVASSLTEAQPKCAISTGSKELVSTDSNTELNGAVAIEPKFAASLQPAPLVFASSKPDVPVLADAPTATYTAMIKRRDTVRSEIEVLCDTTLSEMLDSQKALTYSARREIPQGRSGEQKPKGYESGDYVSIL